ncbi:hypothetical protein SY83_08595 [Paenibacillus swuensis]|uniref:Uncharacterized protein n=1 Tax=Paenibacillus swuensis TaxID=1178515 RepID=A0A172TH91_9BACL|nr:hypothetical protein [Paenibacillus swuensis]ANE46326.1 hypothetical protein SY83_08595 [Paenibacillus swuensis]
MILYQVTCWMNEYHYLKQSIRLSQGDMAFLEYKRDQVLARLMNQTLLWSTPPQSRSALALPLNYDQQAQ